MTRLRVFLALLLSVAFCAPVVAEGYVPVICPSPAEAVISSDKYSAMTEVVVECTDPSALEWARKHLKEWYSDLAPVVKSRKYRGTAECKEAYSLGITGGKVKIAAEGIQGVRYALYTLRQIAIPARGTMTVQGWIVPDAQINDRPNFGFRGVHLCWFPETEAVDIERLIRLAAYYKMNYVVIESWGTFKSEVAPWFGWPDGKMTKAEISRLKAIADDLGVCLIPQLNVFGHASGSRIRTGKHAILDFAPQYQPLFEPEGGWNWCLSNPETVKLQKAIIGEMLDAFGNPPYFHIGCDEAEQPSCPDCNSRPYSEILVEHMESINSYLTSRGVRAMLWHDMLLEKGDKRWAGFYAHGTPYTAAALDGIPRDMIICDWYYEPEKEAYPTMDYFKSKGFDVLTSPWDNAKGILAQGKYASQKSMFGILGTTWHHAFGTALVSTYSQLAESAWSKDPQPVRKKYNSMLLRFATHLRQIGWDMHQTDYRQTGFYDYQVIVEPDGDRKNQ